MSVSAAINLFGWVASSTKKSSLIAIIVYGILEGVMSNGIIFLPVSQFMLQATMAGIHKQLRYFYNQWAIEQPRFILTCREGGLFTVLQHQFSLINQPTNPTWSWPGTSPLAELELSIPLVQGPSQTILEQKDASTTRNSHQTETTNYRSDTNMFTI